MEHVLKYISKDLEFRVSFVINSDLMRNLSETQSFSPLILMGMSRCISSSLLLASHMDEGCTLSLNFQGEGPWKTLFSEATFSGGVRAYSSHHDLDLPLVDGQLDVQGALGEGVLIVARTHPKQAQPRTSTVPLTGRGIGSDIAYYLEQSLQIPAMIVLGTNLDKRGRLMTSGGLLIELLPGASEETISKLEENLKTLPPLSKLLDKGVPPAEIVQKYVRPFELEKMEHDSRIRYECRCSLERVERSLTLLGRKEIEGFVHKDEDLSIQCEFCARRYHVPINRLQDLLVEMSKIQ